MARYHISAQQYFKAKPCAACSLIFTARGDEMIFPIFCPCIAFILNAKVIQ